MLFKCSFSVTGSACAAVPTAIYFDVAQFGDALVCIDIWPRPEILYPGYAIYGMVALYIVPLTIICVCYSIMLRKLWQRVSLGSNLTTLRR